MRAPALRHRRIGANLRTALAVSRECRARIARTLTMNARFRSAVNYRRINRFLANGMFNGALSPPGPRQGRIVEAASAEQLRRVVESQHGGSATCIETVRVHDTENKQSLWDGLVHVFELKNHPKAKRAYAWSSTIAGGDKGRYFAVLHQGRVTSPLEAVRAASKAIHKWGGSKAKA
jgi:hypothetical protein